MKRLVLITGCTLLASATLGWLSGFVTFRVDDGLGYRGEFWTTEICGNPPPRLESVAPSLPYGFRGRRETFFGVLVYEERSWHGVKPDQVSGNPNFQQELLSACLRGGALSGMLFGIGILILRGARKAYRHRLH